MSECRRLPDHPTTMISGQAQQGRGGGGKPWGCTGRRMKQQQAAAAVLRRKEEGVVCRPHLGHVRVAVAGVWYLHSVQLLRGSLLNGIHSGSKQASKQASVEGWAPAVNLASRPNARVLVLPVARTGCTFEVVAMLYKWGTDCCRLNPVNITLHSIATQGPFEPRTSPQLGP